MFSLPHLQLPNYTEEVVKQYVQQDLKYELCLSHTHTHTHTHAHAHTHEYNEAFREILTDSLNSWLYSIS